MAGWSETEECPKCGNDTLEASKDSRDALCNTGICYSCGYYYKTITGRLSLEELNEKRAAIIMPGTGTGLPPLKRLLKWQD